MQKVLKVLKLLVFVLFSFLIILNIMVKDLLRTTVLCLTAKVERKE